MIRTSQHLAVNIASLLEYAHHDTVELKDIEVLRFTPSVVASRAYLGVKIRNELGEKQYLIQIDEATDEAIEYRTEEPVMLEPGELDPRD